MEIKTISEKWNYLDNLEKRKEEVLRIIEEQGKLTLELRKEIIQATKLQMVEDLYRPYKQKRRTKATVAKEKGLEPLAEWIIGCPVSGLPHKEAELYVNIDKGVQSAEEALEGAKDIIAEIIADNPAFRKWIRDDTYKRGMIKSVVKDEEKDEKNIFEMYYEFEEAVEKIVPHRILALNRGEKEGVLRVCVKADADRILGYMER